MNNKELAKLIKTLFLYGKSRRSIARYLNVGMSTIDAAIRGK